MSHNGSKEHTAIIDLLYRLADDELMIGHRNSEWTGVAPILEEDIAFSSMAQDEMGHAQAYYAMLHELGESNPDTLAFRRDPEAFRNASFTALPRKDWARSIVRQLLYDAAEHVRLEAYSNHPFELLAQFARKIHGEEKYHLLHGRTWLIKLGHGTEESRQRLQESLDELWPYALGLFEPSPVEPPKPYDEAILCSEWLQLVCPILSEAMLTIDAAANTDGVWMTNAKPVYGRYAEPDEHRIDLLDAMQKVYRLDPDAQW